MNEFDHCFALCAYNESPYLEECISSLLAQKLPSRVIIATSTPNDYIGQIAEKFGLPLFVNPRSEGIAADWNFAYGCAQAEYVTIAHQDDLYFSGYTAAAAGAARADALLLYTDYVELFEERTIKKSRLLSIKRRMNFPLRFRVFQKSRFVRNRILSLGSSICCPSVVFHKQSLSGFSFDPAFKCDLDWDAWSPHRPKKRRFRLYPPAADGAPHTPRIRNHPSS